NRRTYVLQARPIQVPMTLQANTMNRYAPSLQRLNKADNLIPLLWEAFIIVVIEKKRCRVSLMSELKGFGNKILAYLLQPAGLAQPNPALVLNSLIHHIPAIYTAFITARDC